MSEENKARVVKRLLAGTREAFVTGSHVYGRPTKKSDIDLVVELPWEDFLFLVQYDKSRGKRSTELSLRFGQLNLIVCTDGSSVDWWEARKECLLIAKRQGRPITKRQAALIHRKHCDK
jgi:predicted nucleotidyltransferase